MARSRWELEEEKKKKALEAVKQAAQAGTAYRAPQTAQEAAKAATGTVISRPAQKPAAGSRSAAAATPAKVAPAAQKQSGFRSLEKLPETIKRTAAPTVAAAQQRASDRSRLQENMLAWHGADTAGRRALEQENAAIRGRLGLAYNARTGVTYDPQTGKNYSLPTQLAFGQDAGRRARTASQYPTSREFAGQGADSVSLRPSMQQIAAGVGEEAKGANAHRVLADLFSRSGEAWTERDRENRDAAVLALEDEMARILSRYGLRYSRSGLGASDMWGMPDTVSDRNAAERLRQAGADADEIAYIEENIALREGTHRIRQGAEAAGKGFAGGIASLGENIAQNYENWQENQQNPEYRAAQDELRQIETRIGLTPRQNADGTMNSEYAALEQRAEELRAKMLLTGDTSRVDPDAWGQRMLREAGQAQENATAGLAPVPRFLAGQGISIAQNLPAMGAAAIPVVGPAAASVMMGAGAAGQRAYELNQRADVSPGEALRRGLVSGAVEAATEKFPLDAWADLLTRGGTGLVKNLLRQMGIEATEEGASYLMNYAADRAAGDPKAAFSFQELAENAMGGAVSGLFFGTAGTLAGNAYTGAQTVQGSTDAWQAGMDMPGAQNTVQGGFAANANSPVNTGPVRAGRATTIQSPYTGKMPQNVGTEAQTRPLQIGKADVEGAQQAIFASQQSGTFARTMKSVLQNIFQQNGGARTVTVQGVTFDGQPYDVVLGNKVAAKVASDPNMTAEKLAAFNDIDNIVSTAEYVGSGNYNKNKTKAESVKRYDYFEKTLVIDGKPYVATFDVEVYTDRNNFRTYRVIDEMSLTPSTEAVGPQPTSPDGASSFTNNSISQTNGNGNPSAALVGENGENVLYTKNNKSIDELLYGRLQLPATSSDDTLIAYSIAQNGGDGNPVQELTARLAELDAEKRAAEGALPGPARDARIAEIKREIEQTTKRLRGGSIIDSNERFAQQQNQALREAAGRMEPEEFYRLYQEVMQDMDTPRGEVEEMRQAYRQELFAQRVQDAVDVEAREVPLSEAIQYGKTPEQAMQEARVRAQAEAAQEAARSEREETVSTLLQAWNNKRAAEKQAEQTREALTLTEHDIRLAQNAALSGVDTVNWEYADDPEKAMLYGKTLRAVREADQPIRQYFAQRAAALQSEAKKAADALAAHAKDKRTGAQYQRETMERNIRDIFGKEHQAEAEAIIREYITPVHKAVAEGNRLKNELRGRVKALKLNRHERALVQMRLEAEDGAAAEYIKNNKIKVTPEMDAKINRAVEEFRNIYNELYSRINETLLLNGQEPVLFRMNYAPHFTKDKPDTLLGKIRFAVGLGKDSNLNIPTDIAGQTETFRPGKKWFGNLLQRKGEITDYDAVAGFDQYIEGAVDVITLTESIQKLRALEDQVRYTLSDEGVQAKIDAIRNNTEMDALQQRQAIEEVYDNNRTTAQQLIDELRNQQRMGMGRFVTELRRYTDNLAGKKSREDRGWEDMVNRQFYTVAKNMEGRVAANMISLNPGSWPTNFIPITQASGEVSVPNLVRGMYQTVKGAVTDDGYRNASTFLTNRYGSESIDKTLTRRVSDLSGAPMELIDHFTANTIHRARYAQNIDSGMSMEAAMDDADAYTASLMADRSKGALPTAFNATNPVRKVFTMFQVEVNNQLSYLFKDMPKAQREKGVAAVAWAYTKVFTGAYFFNLLYSQLTGRDSALDPIGMLADALGVGDDEEDERTAAERLGGLAEDIGGQIPFIGGVLFDGGRVPVSSAIPNFANLGKAALPGMFGVEWSGEKRAQTAMKELGKPLTYLVPPFGGGAVRRAVEGYATIDAGGSYTYDNKGNRTLQFPAYGQEPQDYAKAMLFGKWSSEEAQEYIENGFKGLSDDETAAFDQLRGSMGVDARQAMDAILSLRGYKTVEDEEGNTLQTVKEQQRLALFDNENLTPEQKAAVDQALIVSGEDELPADYTDRNAFLLGQYVSESRRDAAREGIEHGLDIDQFVQWDDRLRKLTGEEDANGDRVRNAAEARGMVLDEVMQDGTLSDSEKQSIADYVLISSMGDTQREDWEQIAKGTVDASDYVRFVDDIAAYKEEYKNTGADNSANVAAILRGYDGLTDEQRDVLFQTYSTTMKNNPFHVSAYEQKLDGNRFFADLSMDGKAELRALANEYEQAVNEGRELDDWQGKTYMAKEAGISPETYILFRVALEACNADGKGSAKQSEAETAVNLLPELTQQQKAYLYQSTNSSWKYNPFGSASVTKYNAGQAEETVNPVEGGTLSSSFGPRSSPTAGASSWHKAIDIAADAGTPVRSVMGGTVVSVNKSVYGGGYGVSVRVDHGNGLVTEYHHMQEGSVDDINEGDTVEAGQEIGKVGSTGISTGPHLDLQVWKDGQIIDPLTVIPGYGEASGYVYNGSVSSGMISGSTAKAASESRSSGSNGFRTLPVFKGLKKLGF